VGICVACVTDVDYCQMSIVFVVVLLGSCRYWSKPEFKLVGILVRRDVEFWTKVTVILVLCGQRFRRT
jgi:hypothetical protein